MTATLSSSPLRHLRTADATTTLAAASLLGLLVVSNDDPWLFLTAAVACAVAIPNQRLLLSPWLWGSLFVIVGLRQLATWHTIDDHTIVMTYWCAAMALGLTATETGRTLAASARLLIGTLFAFAAGWKLLSGQFIDGTFFRYSLLFDERFETVARVVGGTSDAVRDQNIDDVTRLVSNGTSAVEAAEGPRNESVALAFTWWGVMIETAVAVTFLIPLREPWAWLRHATLVAFAATTYLIVPVGGFGTLLLILASAMVTTDRARLAYYGGAAALLVWSGLWPLLFG